MQNSGMDLPHAVGPLFVDAEQRGTFTSGVVRWLKLNVERFRPPDETAVGAGDPNDIVSGPARKAFSELGIVLRIARRTTALAARPEVAWLSDAWLSMVDEQSVFADIEERVGLFATYAVLLVSLADLHPSHSEAVRERLQLLISQGFIDGIERTAWGVLDLRYYLDAAGLTHRLPDHKALLRTSSLVSRPALTYARNIDLYAVTHILFDLCDFGMADPTPVLGDLKPAVDEYVGLALSTCVAAQNWDLAAELLVCRLYLGFDGSLEKWAMARLCSVQHENGWVPASTALTDEAVSASGDFDAVYHSTIVCLLLLAAEARSLQ